MDDFDFREHLVFRSEVIAAGGTDAELRRAVGAGIQERIWRGSYLPATTAQTFTEKLERYRAMVIAAARTSGPGRTVSHQSAAALHRVPMLTPDFATVHFTSATTGKKIMHGVIHQAKLADSAVVGMSGVALTSRPRSMCDVARNGTLQQGVCVLDSGLHLGVTMEEIEEEVKRLSRHHGAARLRHAVSLASGLSESVGESLSRLVLADCPSIPPPELQVKIEVEIDGHRKTVRSDYGWRDRQGVLRVVGEFDGKLKYHRSSPWGDRLPEEVLFTEKVREDAIRATGPRMVRWIWRDAKRPKVLHAKVIAALRAGGIID
ncbi:hypothetical protein AAFP30_16710 [Gordonia sp. CPCC 205515]|uniref:hypothetical protein n=1 Tax=Gordonia sp. CPCC 205515 TaxID=3140791 RepID=UPI003AF33C53